MIFEVNLDYFSQGNVANYGLVGYVQICTFS